MRWPRRLWYWYLTTGTSGGADRRAAPALGPSSRGLAPVSCPRASGAVVAASPLGAGAQRRGAPGTWSPPSANRAPIAESAATAMAYIRSDLRGVVLVALARAGSSANVIAVDDVEGRVDRPSPSRRVRWPGLAPSCPRTIRALGRLLTVAAARERRGQRADHLDLRDYDPTSPRAALDGRSIEIPIVGHSPARPAGDPGGRGRCGRLVLQHPGGDQLLPALPRPARSTTARGLATSAALAAPASTACRRTAAGSRLPPRGRGARPRTRRRPPRRAAVVAI